MALGLHWPARDPAPDERLLDGRPCPPLPDFAELRAAHPDGFDLIMADPPWPSRYWSGSGAGRGPEAHYDCMPWEWIAALPVARLAARDCVLWLWGRNPQAHLFHEVAQGWGFRVSTYGTWVKCTPGWVPNMLMPKLAFGGGKVLRSACEPYLIARRGHGPLRNSRRERGAFHAARREHSRKPDEAYAKAERLFPHHTRRLDLFSRERRPGWTSWGLESGKFDTPAPGAAA